MLIRFPLVIEQKGPPKPRWQTFDWWWFWAMEVLTALVLFGGIIGTGVLLGAIEEWIQSLIG